MNLPCALHVDDIRDTVRKFCIEATCLLPEDVVGALQTARTNDGSPVAVKLQCHSARLNGAIL